MKMETVELENGVVKAVLDGRLDIAGSQAVDTPFNVLCGARRKVIVDLSAVSFMASLGIRTIVLGGKAVTNKGGKIVLLNPQPNVEKVLETTGINEIIPIAKTLDEAVAAVA